MPRDSLKWRVNEAVQDSALPPPARLIMLVLSDMADSMTGEIPAKKTPSVTELARRTGLTETTVKTHRAALERLGWIVILRPTAAEAARHVPSRYRIAIGQDPTGGQETTPAGGYEAPPETDPRGSGDDPRSVERGSGDDPAGGQETTTAGVRRRPPSYYYDRNDHNDQLLRAGARDADGSGTLFDVALPEGDSGRTTTGRRNAVRSPEGDARFKIADQITRQWWERLEKKPVGKEAFVARRQIVEALLEAGHEPDNLAEAAKRSGLSMTTKGMEFQLQRLAEERERAANVVVPFQRNGHTGFRDDPNRDYSVEAYLAERNGA